MLGLGLSLSRLVGCWCGVAPRPGWGEEEVSISTGPRGFEGVPTGSALAGFTDGSATCFAAGLAEFGSPAAATVLASCFLLLALARAAWAA